MSALGKTIIVIESSDGVARARVCASNCIFNPEIRNVGLSTRKLLGILLE